ncbi:MAG: hydantoinase/oxoprolinase N-terminal domain-containing protein [Bdellovibrionales bacterium]
MPTSAVLYIGESFAEIGLVTDQKLGPVRRWYLGRDSLPKAVTQFLTEHNQTPLSELVVASKSLHGVLRRRLGSAPAFLVTSGFEQWLTMNRPVKQAHFTVAAERVSSILENNLVFGISERMSPDGKSEKAVEVADLEFLAAKLKLNKVEEVAVGLVHANMNPAHEQLVGQFLRDQGFRVHMSYESEGCDYEVARWWTAITNAYLGHRHREMTTELKGALEASGHSSARLRWLGGSGPLDDTQLDRAPVDSLFGSLLVLHKWRQKCGVQGLLYLGVEDFFLLDGRWPEKKQWRSDFGPVAVTHPGFVRCEMQATQLVLKTFWGSAGFDHVEGGFEPGPMSLGKGLVPQCLDILWIQDRLGEIPGFSERLSEKAKGRIEEALTALGRQSGGAARPPSPKDMAVGLEWEAARRLAAQVPVGTGEVLVCGPLANALQPCLESALKSMGIKPEWAGGGPVMMTALAEWCE